MSRTRMSDSKKYSNLITGIVLKYMCFRGVDLPELAIATRVSDVTMYRKLQHPEQMTLDQFVKVCKKLKIPHDEILPAVMAK